jgi:hypothetical protein
MILDKQFYKAQGFDFQERTGGTLMVLGGHMGITGDLQQKLVQLFFQNFFLRLQVDVPLFIMPLCWLY